MASELSHTIISDKTCFVSGYSCSCPPFECVCSSRVCPSQVSHPQGTWDGYWLPDNPETHPLPHDTSEYYENNPSTPLSYDFNICNDLFQPEEIFQLDQPIRSTDLTVPSLDTASKSPPTLLDLGSGTIHRSSLKSEPEPYWMLPGNSISLEDSNSSCRLPKCSPESLSQTTLEDSSACSINRSSYSPEYVNRMNIGFTNFHFDEKDNYSKSVVEEQSRMYYEDARYQGCVESLIPQNLPGSDYPSCVPLVESRLHAPYHEPVLGPECYPRSSHILPDQSNDAQEEAPLAYSSTASSLHDPNFFQSFPYQHNFFQHLPHH